jgi:hypothetical protein
MMESEKEIADRDWRTLVGIVRGPGNYATPSPERTGRLIRNGLVVRKRGVLRPTLKGRILAWWKKRES